VVKVRMIEHITKPEKAFQVESKNNQKMNIGSF
jgi:hypothetical protein